MGSCSSPIFTEQNWTFPPQWCSFIKLSNGCEVFASNDYYDDVEEEKWPANEYVSCLCFFFQEIFDSLFTRWLKIFCCLETLRFAKRPHALNPLIDNAVDNELRQPQSVPS